MEPYATRFPLLSDLRKYRSNNANTAAKVIPDWLTVISPNSLPVEPLPGSAMANKFLWRNALMRAVRFAKDGGCTVVVGKPSVFAKQLLKKLPECKSIYDAMDDFPAFYTGVSKMAMKRREENIVSIVDEVWTSSTPLYEKWRRQHRNVQLIFNGLDATVIKSMIIKPKKIDQKVYGYLGTIGNWFDWETILSLAGSVPDDIIRIIGPVHNPSHVSLPKNVELLPACEHDQAMREMALFDVGLIPFLQNALTSSVDPIKYYEYRALGLPIISTEFGEMRYRTNADGVYLVGRHASIEQITESVLQAVKPSRLDLDFINKNNWEARFDQIKL